MIEFNVFFILSVENSVPKCKHIFGKTLHLKKIFINCEADKILIYSGLLRINTEIHKNIYYLWKTLIKSVAFCG